MNPPSLANAYIDREERAITLIGHNYAEPEVRRSICSQVLKINSRLETSLIEELRKQNSTLAPSPRREANLKALADGNALTVISGQQVGLFLGPLFTLAKALSVTITAEKLEQESGIRTVPLFWLQSEDHDFDEINQCNVHDPAATLLHLETTPQPEASVKIPVFDRLLEGTSTALALEQIKAKLGHLPHSAQIQELLSNSYQGGRSFPDAFASLLGALFADEGLILFNPRAAPVSTLIRPLYHRALDTAEEVSELLTREGERLRHAGFSEQVTVRSDSPLFFFHLGDEGRFRLNRENSHWKIVGRDLRISTEELQQLIENDPLRFSSSALLRPIIQDYLFPTAAYIAGPAEIGYFGQLRTVRKHFQVHEPLVIPRLSVRLLEAKWSEWLKDFGFEIEELSLPITELEQRIAKRLSTREENADKIFSEADATIETALSKLKTSFSAVDSTLIGALEKSREKVLHQVASLKTRYTRALAERDSISLDRLKKLKLNLYPNGEEQERFYSSIYYLYRYGKELKSILREKFVPYSGKTVEVILP